MKLTPARRIRGRISLPGDKSISHRAALIASLARGASQLTNFSTSQDCEATLSCIERLGARVSRSATTVGINPPEQLQAPKESLDCANSGTTMRLLAGIVAGNDFDSELIGDHSLSSRPMKRIIEPLQTMGAHIESNHGNPPLRIRGSSSLKNITYELPVASAQVKSCLLFAGLNASGRTTVIESTVTRDHTERLFNGFGVNVTVSRQEKAANSISIDGPARANGGEMQIPGDLSSAAYFIAASILPDSAVTIENVSLNPTRTEFISVLREWGFVIDTKLMGQERNEPFGNIEVRRGESQMPIAPMRLEKDKIASLIDELPLLAVVGSQLPGGVEIRGAEELRAKETDRIAATVINLRAMGAEVEEYADGFFVHGQTRLQGTNIDSGGDHRIAMAFSVAALMADGPSEIIGSSCVAISFPEFFDLLGQVVE